MSLVTLIFDVSHGIKIPPLSPVTSSRPPRPPPTSKIFERSIISCTMKSVSLHCLLIAAATPSSSSFSPVSSRSYGRSITALLASEETPEVYPLSQRKALLIKEAQRLDPALAKDGIGELDALQYLLELILCSFLVITYPYSIFSSCVY